MVSGFAIVLMLIDHISFRVPERNYRSKSDRKIVFSGRRNGTGFCGINHMEFLCDSPVP